MALPRSIRIILAASTAVGVAFVFTLRFDLLRNVPGFHCDGWGCWGMGIVYAALALGVIPILSALCGFALSRGRRVKNAAAAFLISLAVMGLTILVLRAWALTDEEGAAEQAKQDKIALYRGIGIPEAQILQELPPLDSRRPITIANQIGSTGLTTIVGDRPLAIRAYARDDAVLPDGTLAYKIETFIPDSTKTRLMGEGVLHPASIRAKDGRRVLEGEAPPFVLDGTTEIMLAVTGKDGVGDALFLQKPEK